MRSPEIRRNSEVRYWSSSRFSFWQRVRWMKRRSSSNVRTSSTVACIGLLFVLEASRMPSLESRRQPCCRAEKDIDQNRLKVRDGARLPSDRYGLADAYNPTNTNLCHPTEGETEWPRSGSGRAKSVHSARPSNPHVYSGTLELGHRTL